MQLKPEEISKVIRSQIKYYENAIQQNETERACDNAMQLAAYLETIPGISVNYPGLASSPWNGVAKQLLNGRFGAILTIRVGSKERAFAITIVSSDAGFVVNDPHQLTAAQMFQKFSACKEEVKRTSILQEVEAKGKVWGTFRMFRNGSRPIMINSEYDAFVDHHEFVYHSSNSPFAPILATDTVDPKKAAVSVLIAPMKANDEIQQVCNRLFA